MACRRLGRRRPHREAGPSPKQAEDNNIYFLFVCLVSLFETGWPQTHYVAQDNTELLVLLPPPPTHLEEGKVAFPEVFK